MQSCEERSNDDRESGSVMANLRVTINYSITQFPNTDNVCLCNCTSITHGVHQHHVEILLYLHYTHAMNHQDRIHSQPWSSFDVESSSNLSRNHPSRGHGPGRSAFHTSAAAITRSLREKRCQAIVTNANGFPYSR